MGDEGKEYWRVPLTPRQKQQLDIELIEELNAETGEDQEITKVQKPKSMRFVALVTVMSFIILALGNWLDVINLPSLDFLAKSWQLSQNEKVRSYQEAVVEIHAQGSQGTGFNISPQGMIVTNNHVVQDKLMVSINFKNGDIYRAAEWEAYPDVDLALIRLNSSNLPYLDIAAKPDVTPKEKVLIIGSPLGFPRIAAEAEVLGKIYLKDWQKPVIVLKGPIYHGSSGSPVINLNGDVVAVVFGSLVGPNKNEDEHIGVAVPVQYLSGQ